VTPRLNLSGAGEPGEKPLARSEEFRWLTKSSHCVLESMPKSAATANDGPSVSSQVLPVVSSVKPPLKR
jgi:hypothetical protein